MEIKVLLMNTFHSGIYQMVTRNLLLKQRSHLLFLTSDRRLRSYTQLKRKHCLF